MRLSTVLRVGVALTTLVLFASSATAHKIEAPASLEELARTADLVCKATVIAEHRVTDDSFKPIYGFEVYEAELRVVSIVKGNASNVIRFRYYAPSSSPAVQNPFESPLTTLLRIAIHYLRPKSEWEDPPLTTGRTYLVVATQIDGDTYRQLTRSSTWGWSQGVLLAADVKPHRGTTLTEAAWSELLGLLKSPREDDVLEAIQRLDERSGGPTWNIPKIRDFERDQALAAIAPLVEAKNVHIATAAITVFGGDSPYFNEQDVQFWFVGIGKGHILGIAPRKKPSGPAAAIGAEELLKVATDGPTPEVRALAIRALGGRSQEIPGPMVAIWVRDPAVGVRGAAALASAELPNRQPIITTASTDASPEVRRSAALAVGFAQDPLLLPLLDKLLRDSSTDVRNDAAVSLLSFGPDRAAPVLKKNLTSDFRPLFVNALASVDVQPYSSMLAEVIEEQREGPDWKKPPNWNYGGLIPAADSWQILFNFVKSRPAAELTAGKFDSSLDALERAKFYSSGQPTGLYALYLSRGMVLRAQQFRETARKGYPSFSIDLYFDRVDRDLAAGNLR